ncbi:MAG: helix-turn-helix transcriptional regulator [Polyangiales bacterium]
MIRNDKEYREAVERMQAEEERLDGYQARLQDENMDAEAIKRVLDPMRSFHAQLREEVESYERLKRGELDELRNLHGLGHALVALRISLGLTQRELAARLGVHETQVSRDERNEYHGITVDRATRVLDALGADLHSVFEQPVPGVAAE